MEYARWAPQYGRIAVAFGYPWEREEAAARLLRSLLPAESRTDPSGRCRARVARREAIVVGLAPGAGPPPLHLLAPTTPPRVLLAADGAAAPCLAAGIVPDLIVTDLDGPVASEVTANARGALTVVHAHGDNGEALQKWVPQFNGELVGSWAGRPADDLIDPGGFTDGDRAAYLAEAAGATSILLWGFSFRQTEGLEGEARVRKLRKLAFAEENLQLLAEQGRTPLLEWRPDGTRRPFHAGAAARSTQ